MGGTVGELERMTFDELVGGEIGELEERTIIELENMSVDEWSGKKGMIKLEKSKR